MTHSKQEILSAMAQGVADLIAPEEEIVNEDESNEPKVLLAPPTVGATVTSQALNKWLTQAIHAAPGIEFTTDHLATTARVAGFIRDPEHLRTFLLRELGIDLVQAPIIDLPLIGSGKYDNTPEAVKGAVLSATLKFYQGLIDEGTSFDEMADVLGYLYLPDDAPPRHPLVEVFEYWDLMPRETMFEWVMEYFLCVQTEDDYRKQLLAQEEKKREDAASALAAAAKAATSGAKLSTASKIAVVPATS